VIIDENALSIYLIPDKVLQLYVTNLILYFNYSIILIITNQNHLLLIQKTLLLNLAKYSKNLKQIIISQMIYIEEG